MSTNPLRYNHHLWAGVYTLLSFFIHTPTSYDYFFLKTSQTSLVLIIRWLGVMFVVFAFISPKTFSVTKVSDSEDKSLPSLI